MQMLSGSGALRELMVTPRYPPFTEEAENHTFHTGGHSSRLRNTLRGAQRWSLRPFLTRAARLITNAQFDADSYAASLCLPRDRFIPIRNGSDLQPPSGNPVPRDRHLIASVGRLKHYKGHQRVIAALPYIVNIQPGVRLWIAGTGPYEAELRRLAAQLREAGLQHAD